MKTTRKNTLARFTTFAACLTLILWSLPGCGDSESSSESAQSSASSGGAGDLGGDGHDDSNSDGHHDEDAGGSGVSQPQNYSQAVVAIHEQLEKIESLMASGGLDQIHEEAAIIRDIANGIGQLAMNADSGVPRDAVREINLTAKGLAALFGPIDEAGDSGDLAGTKAIYDEMLALFATLEKHTLNPETHGH